MLPRWSSMLGLSALAAVLLLAQPADAQRWSGWGPYGWGGYGWGPGYYGYAPYYGAYYPYASGGYYGGYYPYNTNRYSYSYPRAMYVPDNYAYSSSYYTPPTTSVVTSDANTALLTIRVPPGAEVWFGDIKMAQRGSDRQYVTPSLDAGRMYIYDIRTRWMENGREVDKTRHVTIRAGDRITVDFLAPGDAVDQPPRAGAVPRP